ncbi:MAG: phosphatase PAP2 family protein [Gemmatimonadetes bacterium]|nr:phosphatase PAP2 family protein [Gemmatimonadota bacterium]
MIDQATNVVWRLDISVQAAARDSVVQASAALHGIADAANWWGGPGVIWFAAALWLGGRALNRRSIARVGLRGAEGLAVASAVSGIIKGLAGRARPFVFPGEPWHWDFNHGWSDAQWFSMPSGHTTATTAMVVGVLLATRGWTGSARLSLTIPLIASAVLVAFGRVYSNQHWVSDVAVAVLLSTIVSVLIARVHRVAPRAAYDRIMLGEGALRADEQPMRRNG